MNHPMSSTTSRQRRARRQTRRGLTSALALTLLVCLAIAGAACGGEEAETTSAPAAASPSPQGEPVLTVTGAGSTLELTMADLEALPALDGWAGMKTQTGKVLGPDPYTGVGLADLAAVVAEAGAGATVVVTASDGYSVELTYANLTGEGFTTYDPETGDKIEATQVLTPMLAYARGGAPLDPAKDGLLTLQISQPEAGQVVDARWAVSDVEAIEVVTP